jgi:hypothetical protein
MEVEGEIVAQVARNFSVVGDSNIQRNLVDYNCSNRGEMRESQVLPCTSITTFEACLSKVRSEANILILSCLSNFLRDSESASDPSTRMSEVLKKFKSFLFPYCDSNPDLWIFVAPPQFSRKPLWYAESISLSISLLQSIVFQDSTFSNLFLLPSHSNQVCLTLSGV